MKVVVLTTSYPRFEGDMAGRFVADGARHLRERGVDVTVVGPHEFRHYGLAYGAGIVGNVRQRPRRALLIPLFVASFLRAARRASRGADLVHAHWLPSGAVALLCRRPYIVHVHGTDIELARRAPRLARPVLRRARLVLSPSQSLAAAARELGAREVRVIPNGVDLPAEVGAEAEPPEVLFAGRLSAEKGILELVQAAAAAGAKLVVSGDGPLRDRVPGALGFVPHEELVGLYARAAVVACPSHREGFGIVCAEAMAHGKPVVAGAVGGLLDLVSEGETGLLVAPGDVDGLRAALQRLLGDPDLRRRLGAAGRERAQRLLSWDVVTDATLAAYAYALGRHTSDTVSDTG